MSYKIKVTTISMVEVQTLKVEANVRYWEDAEVNGVRDEEGTLMPFIDGELWSPEIDLYTGAIKNWPIGTVASVHYKVCDEGSYFLKGLNGEIVASIKNCYVPSIFSPKEPGYGDYIKMDINEQGIIQDWVVCLSDFED